MAENRLIQTLISASPRGATTSYAGRAVDFFTQILTLFLVGANNARPRHGFAVAKRQNARRQQWGPYGAVTGVGTVVV